MTDSTNNRLCDGWPVDTEDFSGVCYYGSEIGGEPCTTADAEECETRLEAYLFAEVIRLGNNRRRDHE